MKVVFKLTNCIPAVLVTVFCLAPAAQAAYIINVVESGGNIVATGSGSLDLTDLTSPGDAQWGSVFWPYYAWINVGGTNQTIPVKQYSGISGPTSFGMGGEHFSSSGNGLTVGACGWNGSFFVDATYVSGTLMSSAATWDSVTLASAGMTPGTYTWTWGSAHPDSLTVNIGVTPTPEPGSLALIAVGVVTPAMLRLRRSRLSA